MWWFGQIPNHHLYGSLLRGRGFVIALLARATMKLAGPACLAVPTTLRG